MSSPYLLTPGPLTTSARTREAMNRDWGSREPDFIALTAHIRERLWKIAGAPASHTCVLLQGSGTFAVEAAIQTLLPHNGKLLVLVNGAYGRRMVEIMRRLKRETVILEWDEDKPVGPHTVDDLLKRDPSITHGAIVHCETTSGILNPLEKTAEILARHGKPLLIDAISTFGAIELDLRHVRCVGLIGSSNKCLESVPGAAFVIADKKALEQSAGNAASLSLDLYAQWQGFEKIGQWRFTPPTHVLAALAAALEQYDAEGGTAARAARYSANCRALVEGMKKLGFTPVLDAKVQAPIIVTFHRPPRLDFDKLHEGLRQRGYVIYPGKLTKMDTFRIGCIGAIDEAVIKGAVAAVADVLKELGLLAGASL